MVYPFFAFFFFPCPSTKVLLLGAGESGKSTFGKQLKMLNKGALADREKAIYRKGEEGLDLIAVEEWYASVACWADVRAAL